MQTWHYYIFILLIENATLIPLECKMPDMAIICIFRNYNIMRVVDVDEWIDEYVFSELHTHIYIIQMFLFAMYNNVYIKRYAKFKRCRIKRL